MYDTTFPATNEIPRTPKRFIKDPTPRFRPSKLEQIDIFFGSLEDQLPSDHLARAVWKVVEGLDTGGLESSYSVLGRHGYHPKRMLAVWVYASLVGLHHSTKVERACKTDAAYRWLCGGEAPSGPTLRRMRMKHGEFFSRAIEQTVALGAKRGLVDLDALAVDSVRIRAHASMAAVRTVKRSTQRIKTLSKVDASSLSDKDRESHEAKLLKHRTALELCEQRNTTSVVVTNEAAALMKFPSGASAPAHRTTVVASGTSSRFIVGVLVDADSTDHGKLKGSALNARDVLDRLGLREGHKMSIAADAGYHSDRDLQFAEQARDWVDILIPPAAVGGRGVGYLGREHFRFSDDGTAICPAGTKMLGPYHNDKLGKELKWVGVGCPKCALKSKCTPGRTRSIHLDVEKEKARLAMHERMARPGASERYNQRIGTIEPVFSFLEDTMGFRRASSRFKKTVLSEILLKLLAYNIDRLIRAEGSSKKLLCVYFSISENGAYRLIEN
jgi:transposase